MRSYSEKPPARSDSAGPTSLRSQPADATPASRTPRFDLTAVAAQARRTAAGGLAGASQALPHRDRIEQSFGVHAAALTDVRAYVGGPAATASLAMGAEAYTYGDAVAFRDAPTLHTAAHEAAHVVQQRRGLALPDGLGRPDDRHERLADEVADAVVAGRSVEPLLAGPAAPPAPGPAVVQRKSIDTGEDTKEPAVLGNALMTAVTLMMTHTHPTPIGPSAPSLELASLLSLAVKRT